MQQQQENHIDQENLRVVAQTICKKLTNNSFCDRSLPKKLCNISRLLQLPQQKQITTLETKSTIEGKEFYKMDTSNKTRNTTKEFF